jgi:hypothetical protein
MQAIAPEIEVVVADGMIKFLSCLESSTDGRPSETTRSVKLDMMK